MIRPVTLVRLSVSYSIKGDKIYKGGQFSGTPLGSTKGGKIFKGGQFSGTPLGINSNTIHNTIKNSKTYDLALMITAYHFLIKPNNKK